MKTISYNFQNHLLRSVTTCAFLIRITRKDGEVYCFTDHDRDILFGGQVFESNIGLDMVSVIRSLSSMEIDSADLKFIYDQSGISRADVMSRKFTGATMETWVVNWADPDAQNIQRYTGVLGKPVIGDLDCSFDVPGLSQNLKKRIGEITSQSCRAELGDSRCGINLVRFTEKAVVIGVSGNYCFAAEIIEQHYSNASRTLTVHASTYNVGGSDWFTNGLVVWDADLDETGFTEAVNGDQLNDGATAKIQKYNIVSWPGLGSCPTFYLAESADFEIQVGDKFRAISGCLKSPLACQNKFDNYKNYRGEPNLPGPDAAQEYVEMQ